MVASLGDVGGDRSGLCSPVGEHPFLGKEMHTYREFSEETTRLIDMEVQRIIKEAEQTAIQLLTQYRPKLGR